MIFADLFSQFIILVTGFAAMIYATFTGGGALIIVPALIFLGAGPVAAVATNRFGILIASFGRLPKIYGKLNIGKKIPALIVGAHTIGSAIGAWILLSIPQDFFYALLGVILIVGAIITYFSKKGSVAVKKHEISKNNVFIATVISLIIGIYRGFFGPGSGTLMRFNLIYFLSLDFVQTLSLATYSSLFSSLSAAAIFLNAGIIDFALGIPLAIGAFAGSFIGTKIAVEKGNEFIKNIFVAFSMILGVYFVFFR
ncbi:MAG: hypothetical protein COV47_00915 [Candidatus Diapherotrites archaeon CG11_big_fil_rev_8_21_14_0_20_37_9]|nr:MAG: hypothetical protein COV47_00915 [Candidatus Diapherotrites archaeon CG11_big_fil_rev_8_21_14_0_20_37_9]